MLAAGCGAQLATMCSAQYTTSAHVGGSTFLRARQIGNRQLERTVGGWKSNANADVAFCWLHSLSVMSVC